MLPASAPLFAPAWRPRLPWSGSPTYSCREESYTKRLIEGEQSTLTDALDYGRLLHVEQCSSDTTMLLAVRSGVFF